MNKREFDAVEKEYDMLMDTFMSPGYQYIEKIVRDRLHEADELMDQVKDPNQFFALRAARDQLRWFLGFRATTKETYEAAKRHFKDQDKAETNSLED